MSLTEAAFFAISIVIWVLSAAGLFVALMNRNEIPRRRVVIIAVILAPCIIVVFSFLCAVSWWMDTCRYGPSRASVMLWTDES